MIKDDYLKSQENLDRYGFVLVWRSKVWYKPAALTKSKV